MFFYSFNFTLRNVNVNALRFQKNVLNTVKRPVYCILKIMLDLKTLAELIFN